MGVEAVGLGANRSVRPPSASPLCVLRERREKYRGARAEPFGAISDGANSAVTLGVIRSRRQVRVTRRVLSQIDRGSD